MNLTLGDTRLILEECRKDGLSLPEAAYVVATAEWETAHTVKPVVEAFWLSEAWRRSNLRYYPWHGRGYVQLTWRQNYEKAGKELGVNLIGNPDRALDPAVAVRILVRGCRDGWFTGRKLADYFGPDRADYVGARRIVNGTDRAGQIAASARDYAAALEADGYGATSIPAPSPAPHQTGFWASIAAFFAALFGKQRP